MIKYDKEICEALKVNTVEEGLKKLKSIRDVCYEELESMDDEEFDINGDLFDKWGHAKDAYYWTKLMAEAEKVEDEKEIVQQGIIDECYRRSIREIESLN